MFCTAPYADTIQPLRKSRAGTAASGYHDEGYFSLLSQENTTEMMVTHGKAALGGFSGTYDIGFPFGYRNVHKNEFAFDYQKVEFKFKWHADVNPSDYHRIVMYLMFTPEDDPDTLANESENVELVDTFDWNGQAAESPVFLIDPDVKKPETDGSYSILPISLVPDSNVAGVIGDIVPSNFGPAGEKHFVSPKKSAAIPDDYVTLKVEGPTAEQFQNLLEWEGGEVVPNEPLKRYVKRSVIDKTIVRIKVASDEQEIARMNV